MTTPSCRAGDVRGPDDNDRFANDLALQPAEAADLARFLTDEFDLDQPPSSSIRMPIAVVCPNWASTPSDP